MVEFVSSHSEYIVKVVHTGQENLLSAFGCTEDEGSVVPVLPFTDEEEHLREVSSREVYSRHLVIGVYAEVFYKMSHNHCLIVVCRNGIIVHIGLVQLEPVFEVDVVRIHEVLHKPFVEVILNCRLHFDDAVRTELVLLAGCKSRNGQNGCQKVYKVFLHNCFVLKVIFLDLECSLHR